ncbi:DUF5068 domain-containing protein [Macrococcus armenti]|uniref:DUF5068 domain-containing protein n=1 Tax=Macrococcus armenti TaxID=2875764 RepID=UPI001CC9033B|nr:DUF5068 domain-containing protein [Macrococcus armenti]UBH13619.1 DUF5068 domain-containing protein [Macrococcus armenti]UBH22847.1 DUF5068 domain-containing protein [Macrococcus armenti]
MKYVTTAALAGTLLLSACGNKDSDLKQSVEKLNSEKEKLSSEYKSLKEENDKLDEKIKENEDKLKEIEEKREKEIKEQIEKEEAARKLEQEKKATLEKEKKAEAQQKQKKAQKLLKQKTMPNMIEASTNGKPSVVKSIDNVNLKLIDNGIESKVNRIQIFKISNMPKKQVLVFNGATTGYALLYEVQTKNTNKSKVTYNNNGKLVIGEKEIYSDANAFIPQELQETTMKSSNAYNEYAPGEETTSYKSIAIDEATYNTLLKNGAKLYLIGGSSAQNGNELLSQPFSIS